MLLYLNAIILACLLLAGCKANPVEVKPVRYADVNVASIFDKENNVQLITKWTVEFAPSATDERVYVLPPGGETVNRYIDVSASLVRDRQIPLPLPVALNVSRLKNLNGERYSVTMPAIKLPATNANDRVVITFRTSQKKHEAISWLPAGEVAKALVTVKTRGITRQIASSGFESGGIDKLGEWSIEHFVMQADKGTVGRQSGDSAPYVAVSTFSAWPEVWKAEAAAFRTELEKPLSLPDVAPFNERGFQSSARRTLEEKQKISKDLYRWVVKEFAYQAAGFDPLYSTTPRPIQETWKRRTGDCKDLGLIYMKLLQIAGIAAEPVLVPIFSDTYFPKKSQIPTILLFNHLIVHIPELDEYVDLTAGPEDESGALSAAYAQVFGGHMFSGSYRIIKHDTSQSNISVETRIKKRGAVWMGETVWRGEGLGKLKILTAQKLLRDKMTTTQNPKFMENLGMTLVPGSWMEGHSSGMVETNKFSFKLNVPPVNVNNELAYLPRVFSGGNLLKYSTKSELDKIMISPCFRIENSEELLSVEGVSYANLDGIADAGVKRQGLSFSQKIEMSGGTLRVERRLNIDERRVVCTPRDADEQREFFTKVRSLLESTETRLNIGAR